MTRPPQRRFHRRDPRIHRLHLEPLEDRRLLSITVNTLVDEADGSIVDGDVSLRDAIAVAPAGETIDFSVTGAINLTALGQLSINKNLTIVGPGADLLTIHAFDPTPATKNGDGSRVLHISDDSPADRTVQLSSLTLTGGDVTGRGGAIYSWENLSLTDMVITGNAAHGAQGIGGGVWSRTAGALTLTRSDVTGNTATGNGGGLWARAYDSGTASIVASTISGNTSGDKGGGVYVDALNSGAASITDSTISGNAANGNGGGVYSRTALGASTLILQSTISGNSSNKSGGGVWAYALGATTSTIAHSTITANTADADANNPNVETGGGVFATGTGTLLVDHAIIAANIDPGNHAADIKKSITTLTTRWSLIGNRSNSGLAEAQPATPDANGNLVGGANVRLINPQLAPLAENGGPTQTHALALISPAVNSGNPAVVAGADGAPIFDQRGAPFERVYDGAGAPYTRIDVGAYELEDLGTSAPLVVDTLADEDDGDFSSGNFSLREAINLANGQAVIQPTIEFAPNLSGGTILLTLGELMITQTMTIDGRALPGSLTISGGGVSRVLNIDDAIAGNVENVTVAGIVVTGGMVTGDGGGIRSRENLALVDCSVMGNAASGAGGGVEFATAVRLEFIGSIVAMNAAGASGGVACDGSEMVLVDSTIADNSGGGVSFSSGTLTLNDSSISGNIGLGVRLYFASIVLNDSTVTGNSSGGIVGVSIGASATLTNSSVSGNTGVGIAGNYLRVIANGSQFIGNSSTAISVLTANVTLTTTTVAGNGAGIRVDAFGGLITVDRSTISGNNGTGIAGNNRTIILVNNSTISGNGGDGGISSGHLTNSQPVTLRHATVTDGVSVINGAVVQNSLVSSITSFFGVPIPGTHSIIGDLSGVINPTLAANGGPTRTHALLPGSPAINAGDPAAVAGEGGVPLYDQRGFAFSRMVGGRIDIGAFEAGATSANFDDDADVDGADFLAWQRGLGAAAPTDLHDDGDADIDGDVDAADLAVWTSQFGAAEAAASLAAITSNSSTLLVARDEYFALADASPTWDSFPGFKPLGKSRWRPLR